MKRAVLFGLLVVSLAVNAAVAFHALRRHAPGVVPGMPAEPPLFRALALDEAQKAAILARRAQLMALREATSARLAALRGELADAIPQGAAGRARIDDVLARMEGAQREYQRAVVEHLLAVRESLLPAQRPVFERLVRERLCSGWMIQPEGMAPAIPGGGGT
jgi:Spy/CpxP family protein refolding chaperone